MICYECNQRVYYLFDDSRCKKFTRLTPEEIRGDLEKCDCGGVVAGFGGIPCPICNPEILVIPARKSD